MKISDSRFLLVLESLFSKDSELSSFLLKICKPNLKSKMFTLLLRPLLKIEVMNTNAINFVHEQLTGKKEIPDFKSGDNVTVNYKLVEGNKERIQSFKGDVI